MLIRHLFTTVVFLAPPSIAVAQPKPYRLPAVDLKQRVIWGSVAEAPDGFALSFGGQDQDAEGLAHTRIRADGKWESINEELSRKNLGKDSSAEIRDCSRSLKDAIAILRGHYLADDRSARQIQEFKRIEETLLRVLQRIERYDLNDPPPRYAGLVEYVRARFRKAGVSLRSEIHLSRRGFGPPYLQGFYTAQLELEKAADALAPEPPPRALSPLVYDRANKRFILFGGDHLDYLTNDLWIFDRETRRWSRRFPKTAPPPRANHSLKLADGKLIVSGGYTYTSNTDYMGGQYRDLADGDWTYDLDKNTWTGSGKAVESDARTYRTGPFHPDFFLRGERPDRASWAKTLADLPVNTWVAAKPPFKPQLNRDWGTAILDPDRDLIFRFSGGHCAHGGSDVLHYHLATNRWELPFPVEFPLGQLYSNTSYPDGFNFNMRPWVTGHTYQNYGYDANAKRMLFVGQPGHAYFYNPDIGDWQGRAAKPAGMKYDSCFYTLTCCATPAGLVTWTQTGSVFRYAAAKKMWDEIKTTGDKLPGSVVDNSTVVYDSQRDRLLFFRKPYGEKIVYDGGLHALDLTSGAVKALAPTGKDLATRIPYLCQIRYDVEYDFLLVGATLPPDDAGVRRTPIYDCAANEWKSLAIGGTDPSGKTGRNVSLGLVYDAKRKMFWAVDTRSEVFMLRWNPTVGP